MVQSNNMTIEEQIAKAKTSAALDWQSDRPAPFTYPHYWEGKVPLKIRMKGTVTSDLPFFFPDSADLLCIQGNEYYCWVNSYGALSAILPNGQQLGLKPGEFEVVEFHSQNENKCAQNEME